MKGNKNNDTADNKDEDKGNDSNNDSRIAIMRAIAITKTITVPRQR